MTRNELIAKAKELGFTLEKPAHMCTTEVLQEAFSEYGQVQVQAAPTMKSRIIELAKEEKTYKEIQETMTAENPGREVRYGYILLVLKKEGIKVPRSKRKVSA
jgi:hypothetical protein